MHALRRSRSRDRNHDRCPPRPTARSHGARTARTSSVYLIVFVALCVCTACRSFVAYLRLRPAARPACGIILVVAVVKATLVAMIFMHLKFDWGKLYCIVIPVCVMAVMMIIVLSAGHRGLMAQRPLPAAKRRSMK